MQSLIIPDLVRIELKRLNGQPLLPENVSVGIQTFATHKNDINLYPFLSNSDGIISITKEAILSKAEEFISFGIMDYWPLESAKPNINIYFWGTQRIVLVNDLWDKEIRQMAYSLTLPF